MIKLVILLAWFLLRQRHVMSRQRHVIRGVIPRSSTELANADPIVWMGHSICRETAILKETSSKYSRQVTFLKILLKKRKLKPNLLIHSHTFTFALKELRLTKVWVSRMQTKQKFNFLGARIQRAFDSS